jgi:outer membrane receptor protein involved in Fe transport
LCLLLSLGSTFVVAGSGGKISGRVLDAQTKEPLIGANVILDGTTIGSTTDAEGYYVILNIPPDIYTLKVSYVGYKAYVVKNVNVATDFTNAIDCRLEAGQFETQTVVIEGERQPLVRKDLTNPVASISSENIRELPVTDIGKVIGLQAGVTVDDDGSIHIRGGYSNEIAYTLNGMNINNPYGNTRSIGLATNAVQEVSVSSGTFSAEYGTALSGVVNYVTREGGRKWNGSMRWYTGDHVSNRKDLFFNIDDIQWNNVYRLEGSLGGPIVGEDLTMFASGVYSYFGGSSYAHRLYMPSDGFIYANQFPTGDPRKGASTDAYYFGPLKAWTDSTNLHGGPSGDSAIVPLNWSVAYNAQANILYRLSSDIRLKYEFVYDRSYYPTSGKAYWFKPDGRSMTDGNSYFQALELTHMLSQTAFYTLKLSYMYDHGTARTYDDINDPRYLPAFYSVVIPNTSFLTGGVDLSRFERTSEAYTAKFDMTTQLLNIHELKLGFEVRQHKLNVESYTLQFRNPSNPTGAPSFDDALKYGYTYEAYIPSDSSGYVNYSREPVQASAYVQDKIELFESIILNLGLRYDYFDPAANYNPMISDELLFQTQLFITKNLTPAEKKHMVAPRISVSYPITDKGTIRFSYGHFYQIGSLSSLYSNANFRAPYASTPSFGNPNVSPQKSVQYELGLQQGMTDNIRLEITGYYKDVRDYIYTQTIYTSRGDKQYGLLTNLSYANTRGISISLLKRRAPGDPLSATIDYTFQVSEGNRTSPTDELFFNEQQGKLGETWLVPMSFDRSHTITSTVTLSTSRDWTLSLIGYVRTGTPYTPSFPSTVVSTTFEQNSDRQPVQWNVDLKAEKYFQIEDIDFSLFVQVDNLFDTENELYVYANSGRALYDITEKLEPWVFDNLRSRITRQDPGMIPMSYVDSYYKNPGNVSGPRLIRVGCSVNF